MSEVYSQKEYGPSLDPPPWLGDLLSSVRRKSRAVRSDRMNIPKKNPKAFSNGSISVFPSSRDRETYNQSECTYQSASIEPKFGELCKLGFRIALAMVMSVGWSLHGNWLFALSVCILWTIHWCIFKRPFLATVYSRAGFVCRNNPDSPIIAYGSVLCSVLYLFQTNQPHSIVIASMILLYETSTTCYSCQCVHTPSHTHYVSGMPLHFFQMHKFDSLVVLCAALIIFFVGVVLAVAPLLLELYDLSGKALFALISVVASVVCCIKACRFQNIAWFGVYLMFTSISIYHVFWLSIGILSPLIGSALRILCGCQLSLILLRSSDLYCNLLTQFPNMAPHFVDPTPADFEALIQFRTGLSVVLKCPCWLQITLPGNLIRSQSMDQTWRRLAFSWLTSPGNQFPRIPERLEVPVAASLFVFSKGVKMLPEFIVLQQVAPFLITTRKTITSSGFECLSQAVQVAKMERAMLIIDKPVDAKVPIRGASLAVSPSMARNRIVIHHTGIEMTHLVNLRLSDNNTLIGFNDRT